MNLVFKYSAPRLGCFFVLSYDYMEITQIKLGGSLITDKSKPYTAKIDTIRRLAKEIKKAKTENPELNFIVGNGGGSFPHTSAAIYNTANGYHDEKGQYGFCLVQHDAATINRICVKEFVEEGIDTISVSPNNIMITDNKEVTSIYLKTIEELLERKIIPMVYGDTLLDITLGSCIFSCDQVMSALHSYLEPEKFQVIKIISIGDFPGVLDENEQLVKMIDKNIYNQLISTGALKSSSLTDVTGGMKAKLDELMKQAESGIESLILDGNITDNLYNALLGKSYSGTLIKI